jgi:hypothetical protein
MKTLHYLALGRLVNYRELNQTKLKTKQQERRQVGPSVVAKLQQRLYKSYPSGKNAESTGPKCYVHACIPRKFLNMNVNNFTS